VVGGAGKTPVVRDIADQLKNMGKRPHIISRGYGGRIGKSTKVNLTRHTAADVGDEPLLLATTAPVWVGKNKVASAVNAILDGADCLILDDGLQNPTLHKNLSFLVMDGRTLHGQLLPAGRLREPLSSALHHAQGVIWLSQNPVPAELSNAVVLTATPKTFCINQDIKGKKLFAFCGIANPQKFYAGVRDMGGEIIATRNFPDHHIYSEAELTGLLREADHLGATPVTTAKDAVRITPPHPSNLAICDVRLEWHDTAVLQGFLQMLF
jgi:tetraacyldisaccharide 4'-kinase